MNASPDIAVAVSSRLTRETGADPVARAMQRRWRMRFAIFPLVLVGCVTRPIDESITAHDAAPTRDAAPIDPTAPLPCGRTGSAPSEALARASYGMAARWRGTATTPWVAPYTVEIDFHAEGTYLARTLSAPAGIGFTPTPLYYDSDPETGLWKLQNLLADGEVTGWLTLAWLDYQEPLTEVILDSSLSTMSFTFYHLGQYGPIRYDLRCNP